LKLKLTVTALAALATLSACGGAAHQAAAPGPAGATGSATAAASSSPGSSSPGSSSPGSSATGSPSQGTSAAGAVCVRTTADGSCGPYDYSQNTDSNGYNTYVGNDMWNDIPGATQRLTATNPGNWSVVANLPAGNTAVVSYPSTSQQYPIPNGTDPTPVAAFTSMTSTFAENMHATKGTSAEAGYDIWFDNSGKSDELMVQNDMSNRGSCTDLGIIATVAFGGSGGVPAQKWNFCKYGDELIWQLTPPAGNHTAVWGVQSGTVDLLAMMKWVIAHGYLAKGSTLDSVGYGWEICSTGGQNETFQITKFATTDTVAGSAGS
jgi:hypothetical protein